MTCGPLYAAQTHEVCDAMKHACAKADALPGCCCGDRSDANPPRVPNSGTDVAMSASYGVAAAALVLDMPALTVSLVHLGTTPTARPPDLRILFSDLRI